MDEQQFRKEVRKQLKEILTEDVTAKKEKQGFFYSLFTWIYKDKIDAQMKEILETPELAQLTKEIKELSDELAEKVLYDKLKNKFKPMPPMASREVK